MLQANGHGHTPGSSPNSHLNSHLNSHASSALGVGAGAGAVTDLKLAGGCGCSVCVRLGIPEAQTRDGDVRQGDEVMMTNGEWRTTTATASLTTAGAWTVQGA